MQLQHFQDWHSLSCKSSSGITSSGEARVTQVTTLQTHTAPTLPSSSLHFLPDEGVQPVLVVPQAFQFEPLFKEAVTIWILPDEVHACRLGF